MKCARFLLIVFLLLLNITAVQAEPKYATGKDWLLMSQEEKATYIFTAIEILQKSGVEFSRSVKDYVTIVDGHIADTPDLLSADVQTVFAYIVYRTEPGAKETLNRVMKIQQ